MLKNAKIGGKLSIGFGILIVVIIILATVSMTSFSSIKDIEEELLTVNLQKFNLSNRVSTIVRSMSIEFFRIETGGDIRTSRQIITDTIAECNRTVEAYLLLLDQSNQEEMTIWNELVRHRTAYLNTVNIMNSQIDAGDLEGFHITFLGSYNRALDDYLAVIDKLVEFQRQSTYNKGRQLDVIVSKDTLIMAVVIALGLLIAIIFAILITKLITTPIFDCLKIAHALEDGKTKLNIEVKTKDELGELTQAMKGMVAAIQGMVDDCIHLSEDALAGKLSTRADTSRHKNEFATLVGNINSTLDAIVNPLKEAMNVMDRIAHKDLTARINGNYKGDLDDFKQNINLAGKTLEDSILLVDTAVEQITIASNEISSSSQSLAETTSEQASSLEEISSSLEEINSLTSNNADNAKSGLNLSEQAVLAVDKGNEAMEKMNKAMEAILKSSQETGKIIKNIDEIAFQTNLLALNAAVEAAHAGDAGKGFAVVAEEVKNLALRSAEAAKNTNVLIDEAGKNSEMGTVIVEQVTKSFLEMKEQFSKVKSIVNEISASSDEQASGVNQISTGVNEMNRVTQQNAANAEESAAAAEELNGQAAELRALVSQFTLSRKESGYKYIPPTKKAVQIENKPRLALTQKPENILPMDSFDDEFDDF